MGLGWYIGKDYLGNMGVKKIYKKISLRSRYNPKAYNIIQFTVLYVKKT